MMKRYIESAILYKSRLLTHAGTGNKGEKVRKGSKRGKREGREGKEFDSSSKAMMHDPLEGFG